MCDLGREMWELGREMWELGWQERGESGMAQDARRGPEEEGGREDAPREAC